MRIRSTILLSLLMTTVVLFGTYFLPFEWMVFFLFVLGSLSQIRKWKVFLIGLIVPAIIWVLWALITDYSYQRSVTDLTSEILGGLSSGTILTLVGLTVGLVGGFSALSGNLIRSIIVDHTKQK